MSAKAEVCANCRFWETMNNPVTIGRCRRYAPRPVCEKGIDSETVYAEWPLTADKDWCGEFQAQEGA